MLYIQIGGKVMDDKNYPLVRMKNIDKIFYGSYANRDVDFELFSGEVHSILGRKRRRQNNSYELPRRNIPA
jgi:nucleoside ABC transporter ATP-binding protein